jgi:Flp pilus assembly pilin Flp
MELFLASKGAFTWLRSRMRAERGASAVEYSIVVSLIAVAVIVAVFWLGQSTNDNYVCTKNSIAANANQC